MATPPCRFCGDPDVHYCEMCYSWLCEYCDTLSPDDALKDHQLANHIFGLHDA
jgi:hypothetical protein